MSIDQFVIAEYGRREREGGGKRERGGGKEEVMPPDCKPVIFNLAIILPF